MTTTNRYEMNEAERAERSKAKDLHARVRAGMREAAASSGEERRSWLLAWGYVRGLRYRRIERKRHIQTLPDGSIYEHNAPSVPALTDVLGQLGVLPPNASRWQSDPAARQAVVAWLADPSGAIPAPTPAPKPRPVPVVAAE